MARKETASKNGKTEVVETTPVEITTPETVAINAQDWIKEGKDVSEKDATLPETAVETAAEEQEQAEEQAEEKQYTAVDIVCNDCDDLNVEELKQVIDYCSSRIDELQREEVEALEEQMRAIQEKLMAMRGYKKPQHKDSNGHSGAERVATPLVNPKNPSEVYTFGKHPEWIVKLMAETGKSVYQLREEASKGM